MLMKTKLTILSALSLVVLMACEREKVEVNPTYDPDRNTVTTKLVLNVSTTNGAPKTKQTAQDVQAGGANFRGMTDVHVLAYSLEYAGVGNANYLYKVADQSSMATRDYNLGNMVTDITSSNSTRILELALPLGTNSILLYGKANKTGTDNAQGAVIASGTALNSTLEDVSFKLKNRLTSMQLFSLYGDLMGRILTGIMNSGLVVETTQNGYKHNKDNRYNFWFNASTHTGAPGLDHENPAHDTTGWAADPTLRPGYVHYTGSQTWRKYGLEYATRVNDDDEDDVNMDPLEEVLGEAYYEIVTLQGTEPKVELRTASSASILRMTSDLYNILIRVQSADPNSADEYLAQLVAGEILERAKYFYALNADGDVVWQPWSAIQDAITAVIPDRTAAYYSGINDDFFYSAADNRIGFPLNLGLPMGAAIMRFDPRGNPNDVNQQYDVVSYLDSIPAYGMGGAALSINNYRYPAELMYYTNSSLRVSDNAVETNTYPLTPAGWNNDNFWSQDVWTNNGQVQSTTRAVAVSKPINYGTALMKSVVGYSDSQVEDNNHGVHPSETNNIIEVESGNKFEVTGIMIGGVCDEVGYDFLPIGSFDKMIYDKLESKSFYIPVFQEGEGRLSNPVYTLTWDNYNRALEGDDGQTKVYVALEVVNRTGRDIWGELNLIRNGGTFYLVGELNPHATGVDANLRDEQGNIKLTRPDFFYPPFDPNTGATRNVPRVFMQDYMTSVVFNFTRNSLQHAYITMPDLRSGQVSLGLSVDIKWEEGMEFSVNLGETTDSNQGN